MQVEDVLSRIYVYDLISLNRVEKQIMNITIEKIDPNNELQAEAYCSWLADELVVNNWFLQNDDEDFTVSFSINDFKKAFSKEDKVAFIIKDDFDYFGYGSFFINHPAGMYKEGRVCWPSLAIGKSSHRGKGLSKHIFSEIRKLAIREGCTHVEAGIFDFNEAIRANLIKMGFKLIGRRENLTFVDGKWWGSEHYLIELK
ncbi:GNAT family N-acetyltransferase [Halobacteriovorax sp. ZH3_bin.1]|uniref:GNAT family N-acetyltransferase n=2 Tax=Halobacteriovorax TaxID=1652133 RepID=UPI003712EBFF